LFRWGIIGSGFAARKFVLGLRQSAGGRAVLVQSRSAANAHGFARDFGIGTVASSLADAVRSPEVDAFYIATPPTAHREEAIACLTAGKPVLIEKPFAASLADAEAIAAAARATGVFCMEGMWTRFLPLVAELRALVRDGAIGTPRSLQGSFGVSNLPEPTDNQFNPTLGGGALLHRAIYPVAMAFDLLGDGDLVASAATAGESGVDEDCVVVIRHGGGALSTLRASLRASLPGDLTIEGTHGRIHVASPMFRPFRLTVIKVQPVARGGGGNPRMEALREGTLAQTLHQRMGFLRSVGRTLTRSYAGNGYHYEADEVMACVQRGATESEIMPLSQSLALAALIDRARAAWTTT
jgi:predicted dehydrogenase